MDNEELDPKDLLDSSSAVWMRLPSAPTFMCIMRTRDGKPVGTPIWKTFEHRPGERSLSNETVSSTLLNLSNLLASTVSSKEEDHESIMKISFHGRSWSIYSPSPRQGLQMTFVVAFEETDQVRITEKDRAVLTKSIVQALKEIPEFITLLESPELQIIEPGSPLYKQIFERVSKVIQQWDKKRIEYLKEEAKRVRERLIQEAKEKEEEEKINAKSQ